ncbi:CBS domain-containing protein [Streptomyces sp. NPDC054766]|uniref:CBS domain-containing protein n=1 Tax=Streptomyces rhizosphaerihabitans TaxID=1266770 RepID=UPI0021BE3ED8|nr:CBS domain-containing protein [Streptomyces rhizosphaerihabitans]MCT9009008.1 CBS domain-containing protein [Streptomyces rhizosphaerihabitans]WRZ95391.1 CBS domain-containing protein [Streptomyces sp. NBC_01007]
MVEAVRDVMTGPPRSVLPRTPVTDVARYMRDEGIGAVLVTEGGRLRGVVTDRDLVVRVMCRGGNIDHVTAAQACSDVLVTVSPDDDIDRAVTLMRQRAVRRIPVVDDGRPVGIVTLGDIAVENEPDSVLSAITTAAPNE